MATDQLGGNSSLFWERYEMATRRMRDDWHCRLELLHKRKLANAARQLVLFLGRKAKKKNKNDWEIPSKANILRTREIDKTDGAGAKKNKKKQVPRQQKIKQIRASVNKSRASIGFWATLKP